MNFSKKHYYYDERADIMEDDEDTYYSAADNNFDDEEIDDAFECLSHSKKNASYGGHLQHDSAFIVHNSLDLRPHATLSELLEIMENYKYGDREKAQLDMLGIMDSYLIHLIMSKYSTYTDYMEELMSQGYIGILVGMKSYDPHLGKPTTWFSRYINHEIQSYINSQINHSTQHYNSASKQVYACIDHKIKNKIPFTKGDIYRETGVPLKTIEKCMRIKQFTSVSINAGEKEKELPSEFGDPLQFFEERSEREIVDDLIFGKNGIKSGSILTDEERECITLRFGFDGKGCRSFSQIENITGIPKYHVGKIQASALRKLEEAIKKDKKKKHFSKPQKAEGTEQYIFGELLTEEEMENDQEEISELYRNGLLD